MLKEFEVRWEGALPAAPQEVWAGITERGDAYLWPISYEPRLGGAESGLTSGGGTVTAWEPATHFATRSLAEEGTAGFNELDYVLEPLGSATLLRYRHRSVVAADEFDVQLDACRRHTTAYLHFLGQYACFFPGRVPAYVGLDAPDASADGGFAAIRLGLGLPDDAVTGDPVVLSGPGGTPIDGVVDHLDGTTLGVRTADTLLRVYGRDAWGWPVGLAVHAFAPDADGPELEAAWGAWLAQTFAPEA